MSKPKMEKEAKTKTVLEIAGIVGASNPNELKQAICDTHCIGRCPENTCSKITQRWVSEAEYKRLQTEVQKFKAYRDNAVKKWCDAEGRLSTLQTESTNIHFLYEQAQAENDKLVDACERLSAIDLFAKKLNQKYGELLKGEQANYATAQVMEDCAEKSDLLSHSWGRIKLLKDILQELGVLLSQSLCSKELDQKGDKSSCWFDHCEEMCQLANTNKCPLPKRLNRKTRRTRNEMP